MSCSQRNTPLRFRKGWVSIGVPSRNVPKSIKYLFRCHGVTTDGVQTLISLLFDDDWNNNYATFMCDVCISNIVPCQWNMLANQLQEIGRELIIWFTWMINNLLNCVPGIWIIGLDACWNINLFIFHRSCKDLKYSFRTVMCTFVISFQRFFL